MAFVIPAGHPPIPSHVRQDELVAIVTIQHPRAEEVNRGTPYLPITVHAEDVRPTRQNVVGAHIFLRRINGQQCFVFGREQTVAGRPFGRTEQCDVYLPGTQAAPRQFVMLPVWDSDCWRVQSTSDIITMVNDVPIQVFTPGNRRSMMGPLPQAIHLGQDRVNRINIAGLRIDIWVMNPVRSLYTPHEFKPAPLNALAQDVTSRFEFWARDRFLLKEQVSTKSHRALERFTGEIQTVKLFRSADGGHARRNQELAMLNKQEIDQSIVRYLLSAEVNSIPAIVTESLVGFSSYSVLRDEIRQAHPGVRFAIAAKVARRVFSALAFLHFHGIVHGHLTHDSVLLRTDNDGKTDIFLVDYTTAQTLAVGFSSPRQQLTDDAEAVMKLVDDCCDLWALRNGPTPDADGEYRLEQVTKQAMEDFQAVERCTADYFERQQMPKTTSKGKKLMKLLEKKVHDWHAARANQEHNLKRRQVNTVTMPKIKAMKAEWNQNHASPLIGEEKSMILSLGHRYLDSLADPLFFKRWDLTPSEICAKIKELGGDLENPWQTFEVKVTTPMRRTATHVDEQDLMSWLAQCAEVNSEWRTALQTASASHLHPTEHEIARQEVHAFFADLQVRGRLPTTMMAMLEQLSKVDDSASPLEQTHHVWYHVPSRMFNLTGIQRLATPEGFVATVEDANLQCDNFVEVRGDAKIQGSFAPLSLLADFTKALGIGLPLSPDLTTAKPTYDPSDFSRISQGRIVLARPGMLGFGSILRQGDQCCYGAAPSRPTDFETASTFVPTNFGDMKVLPKLAPGARSYERSEHWSHFKTAEEIDNAADLSKRNILAAKRPTASKASRDNRSVAPASSEPPAAIDFGISSLQQVLKQREQIRVKARPPAKRSANGISSRASTPDPKRVRSSAAMTTPSRASQELPDVSVSFVERMDRPLQSSPPPGGRSDLLQPKLPSKPCSTGGARLTASFLQRNNALLSSPPHHPSGIERSFTVADDTEALEEDWRKVNEMLQHVSVDEDDEPPLQGMMFGFQVNQIEDDGSATEVDEESFAGRPGLLSSASPALAVEYASFGGGLLKEKGFDRSGMFETETAAGPSSTRRSKSRCSSFSGPSRSHRSGKLPTPAPTSDPAIPFLVVNSPSPQMVMPASSFDDLPSTAPNSLSGNPSSPINNSGSTGNAMGTQVMPSSPPVAGLGTFPSFGAPPAGQDDEDMPDTDVEWDSEDAA